MFIYFFFFFFFFNDTATTEIYTLSLHDALPISSAEERDHGGARRHRLRRDLLPGRAVSNHHPRRRIVRLRRRPARPSGVPPRGQPWGRQGYAAGRRRFRPPRGDARPIPPDRGLGGPGRGGLFSVCAWPHPRPC